jgi:small-conductance mechanosensitive channel
MSAHSVIWLVGLTCLLVAVSPLTLFAVESALNAHSLASIVYLGALFALGASSFVAALRAWPVTLRKLASLLPWGNDPKLPLTVNDGIPIILTGSAAMGFVLLGVLTTPRFAGIVAVMIALIVLSRHLLNAPTSMGRKVLVELGGFREFLKRADADRLNRENHPGRTPETFEQYTAYAVALGVERGWGQDLAATLFELLQFEQAADRLTGFPRHTNGSKDNNRSSVLRLFDSK